jgi:hypothetical protein
LGPSSSCQDKHQHGVNEKINDWSKKRELIKDFVGQFLFVSGWYPPTFGGKV